MNILLAWRNIWRNPRRTGVILASVIIGVWSMVFLGAFMRGMLDGMVQNAINTLTGHIQIRDAEYREDPGIAHLLDDPEAIEKIIRAELPDDSKIVRRIRVNAVASTARYSTGIILVGIDPEKEKGVSFIGSSKTDNNKGESESTLFIDHGKIIVGNALMKRFGLKQGQKMVIMSEDVSGNITSRAFRVQEVFRADMEGTEKEFVFASMDDLREMLGTGNKISEISIKLSSSFSDKEKVSSISKKIESSINNSNVAVSTWLEIMAAMAAYLGMADFFIIIWYFIVFVAMGFGIVNTVLMAVFERMREFGLLKALGMRPVKILSLVVTETILILCIGIMAGDAAGWITTAMLEKHGIDLSSMAQGTEMWGIQRIIFPFLDVRDILISNGIVIILGILVSLYPAFKAARFLPVETMRST